MPEGAFPATRYSVLSRMRDEDPGVRREALSAIVEAYWKPAYKHIRLKWKASPDEARDLTQTFFASLLERELLSRYDPGKAAFRTYLRTCIDGVVANERKSASRVKRGGESQIVSLDFQQAESEVALTAAEPVEEVFYREWQRQMFSLAVEDLRRHCEQTGRQVRFLLFERYDLAAGEGPSYEALAAEFRIPVTAVTNHMAWARRELRRCLWARLAVITAGEPELSAEASRLMGRP